MPPSMRCAYNCKKDATEWVGDSNRDQLNLVLKEQAMALPDKEEHLKWEPGAKRGKVWVPRQSEQETLTKEYSSDEEDNVDKEESLEELDSEYTAALQLATATDIQDIADILGVTFQEHCKATQLKVFPAEPPNQTNIEEVITKATNNDCELLEINLNNLQNISHSRWEALFSALRDNNTVEVVQAANCNITDTIALNICQCLEANKTIRHLNLESNSVSAGMVIDIIKSTANSQGLEELKVASQFCGQYLGSAVEYGLIELLPKVPHLVKLGVRMEFRDSLNKCALALARNLDRRRQTEDRTYTLKLDKTGKTGPQIVSDKK